MRRNDREWRRFSAADLFAESGIDHCGYSFVAHCQHNGEHGV
jgi:hypothetical protein